VCYGNRAAFFRARGSPRKKKNMLRNRGLMLSRYRRVRQPMSADMSGAAAPREKRAGAPASVDAAARNTCMRVPSVSATDRCARVRAVCAQAARRAALLVFRRYFNMMAYATRPRRRSRHTDVYGRLQLSTVLGYALLLSPIAYGDSTICHAEAWR